MAHRRTPRHQARGNRSWERRLRDMLLAGGALALAGSPGCTSDDSGASGADAGGEETLSFCCNANSDPCCTFEYCGAPMSAACACKLDGGTTIANGKCSFDDGSVSDEDAATPDDAGADADADVTD